MGMCLASISTCSVAARGSCFWGTLAGVCCVSSIDINVNEIFVCANKVPPHHFVQPVVNRRPFVTSSSIYLFFLMHDLMQNGEVLQLLCSVDEHIYGVYDKFQTGMSESLFVEIATRAQTIQDITVDDKLHFWEH